LAAISEGFFWFTVAGPDLLVPTAVAGHGAQEAFCEVLAGGAEEEKLGAEAMEALAESKVVQELTPFSC